MFRAAALAFAITSVTVIAASAQGAASPADVKPLGNGLDALNKGVDVLCPWFFSPAATGSEAGLPFVSKVRIIQTENGFFRGGGLPILFPSEPGQVSSSLVSMRAVIKDEGSNDGIMLFMQFHYPVCQMQVFGHAQQTKMFIAGVDKSDWTKVGKATTANNVQSQRYRKSVTGPTLVINRSLEPADGALTMVVNYFAGNEQARGELK